MGYQQLGKVEDQRCLSQLRSPTSLPATRSLSAQSSSAPLRSESPTTRSPRRGGTRTTGESSGQTSAASTSRTSKPRLQGFCNGDVMPTDGMERGDPPGVDTEAAKRVSFTQE